MWVKIFICLLVSCLALNPAQALSISASFGSGSSENTYESHDVVAQGSRLTSGGDLVIAARGDEAGQGGDLNVIGSRLEAGERVLLAANNDLNLLSAEERSDYDSHNSSSSASFGVAASGGSGGLGISIQASGSRGRGEGSGRTVAHVETVVQGGKGVEFASVNDTTLKGAQIIGEEVVGVVGGNLNIVSEQDTSVQSQSQSNQSFGVSIPVYGGGEASLSFSSQNQKAHGNYASVNEQSGIFAGSGGFDLTVGRNTNLAGAVIAGEADPALNSLVTASLTVSDIENHADFSAKTSGLGLEVGGGKGSIAPSLPMKEDGGADSVTRSAVAGGTVIITDEAAQLARTGQTAEQAVASLNRDTVNAHQGPLAQNPDLGALLEKQAEIADAAGQAGRAVAQTVGDIALSQYKKTGDDKWAEGGLYKILLQSAGAALVAEIGNGEGLNAALGAAASQLAAGQVREVAQTVAAALTDDPKIREMVVNILSNAASSGLGLAAGGESGAALASAMDRYNRQLHKPELARLRELADGDEEKFRRLLAVACAKVLCYAEFEEGSEFYNYFKSMADLAGGDGYREEWDLLADQTYTSAKYSILDHMILPHTEKLFEYAPDDWLADYLALRNNAYNLVERGGGLIQFAGASFAMSVCGAAVLASSETGAGFLAMGGVVYFWDQANAGYKTMVSGQYNDTLFVEFLKNMGLTSAEAMAVTAAIDLASLSLLAKAPGIAAAANQSIPKSQVLLRQETGIKFVSDGPGIGIQVQGLSWEDYLAKNLGRDAIRLPVGFKTFDFYDPATRTAISAKTLDTQSIKYLKNPDSIYTQLEKYIDVVADKAFESGKVSMSLYATDIDNRVIRLAIPSSTTSKQNIAISRAVEYAKERNIALYVDVIK